MSRTILQGGCELSEQYVQLLTGLERRTKHQDRQCSVSVWYLVIVPARLSTNKMSKVGTIENV